MKILSTPSSLMLILANILVLSLFLPKEALADGVSLKISPSTLHIEAEPPADTWAPFTIENQSNQPVTFTIGYKAFDPQASQNGTVVFLKNGQPLPGPDKNIFEKMQVVDDNNVSHDSIDLGPFQKERLRLRIEVPQNEKPSDYYFSLIFLQNTNKKDQSNSINNIEDQKSFSTLQAGIGINVLLAIGNKEIPQGTIDNFSVPWYQQAGPVPFTLTVHNNGLHFLTPHGTIFIKNMFGQTIGKLDIPSTVILAGTSRTLSGTNSQTIAKNDQTNTNTTQESKSPVIIWPEHFLLGYYTATLSFSLSKIGPTYTRTIHFIALPFSFLIELLIIIVILVLIYLRVKKKIAR